MSTTHWKAYQSCMSAAKGSREYAVYFAERRDWDYAYGHAATAKTAQLKANEHFEFYLDALALDTVCGGNVGTRQAQINPNELRKMCKRALIRG